MITLQSEQEVLTTRQSAVRTWSRLYSRGPKRALDLLIAIPLAICAFPVVLFCAAIVVATSGWPPFYSAARIGKEGRPFRMYKLRTMRRDADQRLREWLASGDVPAEEFARSFKLTSDPRITRFGRFLRSTSLDELPQLLNVIAGDMSLVGPRPIVIEELDNYGDNRHLFLSVRPGVTGLWQISGRNAVRYPERAELELTYIENLGLLSDIQILFRTLPVPLDRNGL